MAEAEVLKACLEYLQLNGFYCWRNNTGAVKVGARFIRYGFVGSSDILGICPDGRFLAVECKREKGGVLSEAQKTFLSEIEKRGGVALVCNGLKSLQEGLKNNSVYY